jgi:hypothetical protein
MQIKAYRRNGDPKIAGAAMLGTARSMSGIQAVDLNQYDLGDGPVSKQKARRAIHGAVLWIAHNLGLTSSMIDLFTTPDPGIKAK